MNLFTKRSLQALVAGSALIGSFTLAGTALAAGPGGVGHNGQNMPRPAVIGTVATVSGNTFTVTTKNWQRGTTTAATYTVDGSSATVTKNGTASTLSAVVVGDTVMIRGTISGTNVTASVINDGKAFGRPMMSGKKPDMDIASHTPPMGTQPPAGNGQPVIGGKVTAVSGNIVTVTNKSNVTYTIDATNATVTKAGIATATITNVAVGDSIVAQGAINGTSMTAASVLDQGTTPSVSGSSQPEKRGGMMNSIGGFFSHLFGFF